jgi:hypothetical protein
MEPAAIETATTGSEASETAATDPTAFETTAFGTAAGRVVVTRAASPTRKHGLALVWWTATSVWAYFTFGELVVAAGYPEALAVIGVVAGFVLAGRRVSALFADAKAIWLGAAIAILMSAVTIVLGPAILVTFIAERGVALIGLVLSVVVALVSLRLVRRRERSQLAQTASQPALGSVVAWLLVLVFTVVAATLATRG